MGVAVTFISSEGGKKTVVNVNQREILLGITTTTAIAAASLFNDVCD